MGVCLPCSLEAIWVLSGGRGCFLPDGTRSPVLRGYATITVLHAETASLLPA